jgi:hypothetical protein
MSLVEQLINDAVDDQTKVGFLLRKAKVLAYKLDAKELARWAENEMGGYQKREEVPDYRIATPINLGYFSGPFGSGLKNARIPMAFLPESVQEQYGHFYAMQNIQVYEEHFSDPAQTSLEFAWDPNVIAILQRMPPIYEGYVIAEARQSIARPFFVGIIDTVRNRLLNLLLELQSAFPETGKDVNLSQIPRQSIHTIFNMTIYGGQQNIASEGGTVTQPSQTSIDGDFQQLAKILRELGVRDGDIAKLEVALIADQQAAPQGQPGARVKSWIGDVAANAAGGAATHVLVNLPKIVEAIQSFTSNLG